MTAFLVSLIIACIVLAVALWAISMIAPADIQRVLRIIAIGIFLVWLVVRALPMLGVS
jgi:hypothetical protein